MVLHYENLTFIDLWRPLSNSLMIIERFNYSIEWIMQLEFSSLTYHVYEYYNSIAFYRNFEELSVLIAYHRWLKHIEHG